MVGGIRTCSEIFGCGFLRNFVSNPLNLLLESKSCNQGRCKKDAFALSAQCRPSLNSFLNPLTYKQNNTTSNIYKTTASIHQHYTRYSDKDNYNIQPINLSLQRKAINVTGSVIWAKIPTSLKKYSPKTFARKFQDHLISKKQGTVTS